MKKVLSVLFALVLPASVLADVEQDIKLLKDNLAKEMPSGSFKNHAPTPITGLYQVVNDGRIFYLTPDLKYAVRGNIIDLDHGIDLTAIDQGKISYAEIEAIGEKNMVVFDAKDGKAERTITVFTDTSCPYCAKLHEEVPALNEAGIKVRYLLYPRAGLESDAAKVLESVWCAEDRQKAMTDAKTGVDIAEKTCDNPISSHIELGGKVGLRGTPLVFLDSGAMVSGYRPADVIIKAIEASSPLK